MASEQLLVTLGVQDKNAKSQITALNKELRLLDKEFKVTDKASKGFENGTESLGKKLDVLNKKYDVQKTKIDTYKNKIKDSEEQLKAKKTALDNLTNAEGDNEKQIQQLTNEIQKMEQDIRRSTREMALTEAQLSELEGEIKDIESAIKRKPFEDMAKELQQLGEKVDNTGQKLQSIGQGMSSTGDKLLAMSAPVVAFGAYAVKATSDFEQGMAEVQAISGATTKDLEQLKDKAKEMGATTKFSATESAEAMKYMAMAGWKTTDMVEGISGVMDLAAASGENLGSVADILTDGLTAFGMAAEESGRMADVLASASSNANTNVEMLGESFKYVAPVAGAMNYTIEDTALALGLMANAGIKGSQSGTALRTAITNMVKPTDNMEMIMRRYNLTLQNTDGSQKSLVQIIEMLRNKFGGLEEDVQAADVAMLFGKEAMAGMLAVINASPADFDKLKGAIDNSNGSAKEMAEIMNNTAKGQITLLKSQLEGLGIQIGEKLLPHVNNFIAGLSDLIGWFSSLDEGTQQTIMKMGLMAFGMGSALKVVGSFTSGIGGTVSTLGKFIGKLSETNRETNKAGGALGGLTKAFGKTSTSGGATAGVIGKVTSSLSLSNPIMWAVGAGAVALGTAYAGVKTHAELMGKSVLTASEDLGTFEEGIAWLTGTTFESSKALEDAGLKAKGFRENVGEDFKNSVVEAEKSINNLTLSLREVNFDDTFTTDEQESFKTRVKGMCDGAIETIKSKQEESTEELKKLFMNDGVIDETEQKTLEFLNNQSNIQTEKIGETEKSIYSIMEQGLEDKGFLNDEEIRQIEEHLATIQQVKLEATATNNDELLEAQADFLARVKNTDLEEASTLLQEKATLRDQEIESISLKYDKQIELLKLKNQTANEEERLNNEAVIASLEEQKTAELGKEIQKYDEYLRIMDENNPLILDKVNKLTGDILTKADEKKVKELKSYKSCYDELNNITATGMYALYNKTSDSYDDVYVVVDDTTGKITGAWSDAQKQSAGLNKKMADTAKDMAKSYKSSNGELKESILGLSEGFVDSNGNIVNANGKVITSLEEFETQADGTRTGIINLNGEKIEIESNADGRIEQFEDLKRKMQAVPTSVSANVNVYYKEHGKPKVTNSVTGSQIFSLMPPETQPMPMPMTTFSSSRFDGIEPMNNIETMFDNRVWSGGLFSSSSKDSKSLVIPRNIYVDSSDEGAQGKIDIKELVKEIVKEISQAAEMDNKGVLSWSNSKGDVNITQNIYSPKHLTPSEVARQTKNAQRKLALEF